MSDKEPKTQSRSPLRLLLFEALALGGYLYLRNHPLADTFWDLNFRTNALIFMTAYPLLFVYRWKVAGGCLGMILWPLSYVLSLGLGISCYLWIIFCFYYLGSPFFKVLTEHGIVLGLIFALVYFPLLEPILGVSKKYFSFPRTLWILLFSAFGGFLGYLLGQFVIKKVGISPVNQSHLFLLWLGLVFMGAAVGALGAQRKGGDS
jgi:hypothetical protein